MAAKHVASRTFVIGLGDVVKPILDEVYKQFDKTKSLDHLRVLWLRSNDSFTSMNESLKDECQYLVINESIETMLSAFYYNIDETRVWCAPHWKRWTWGELRSNRVYGKLWVQKHIPTIEKLLHTLWNTSPETTVSSDTAQLAHNALSVFLIVPLIDAFASGAWLDVAYLLQKYFETNRTDKVRVSGILLLPTPSQNTLPELHQTSTTADDRGLIHSITYAALRELQALLQQPSFYQNYHREIPIEIRNRSPFALGDCFLLGGTHNERNDTKQPIQFDNIVEHCVKLIYYSAQGVMMNQSPAEQAQGIISDHPVEPVLPRIPYFQLANVQGIASVGFYQHTETLRENTQQHALILQTLVEQLLGDTPVNETQETERFASSNRFVTSFQEIFRAQHAKITEKIAIVNFDKFSAKLTSTKQDEEYAEALRGLIAYEKDLQRKLEQISTDQCDDLPSRLEKLICTISTITLMQDNLVHIQERFSTIEKIAKDSCTAEQTKVQNAIDRLRQDRARRHAFAVVPALAWIFYILMTLLWIGVLALGFTARWIDLERLLLLIGGGVVVFIYALRAHPDRVLQEQIRQQQQDLLRLQRTFIELQQEHAFWRKLLDTFNQLNQQKMVSITELKTLHATALKLRNKLAKELNTGNSNENIRQREIEHKWQRLQNPAWNIVEQWLALIPTDDNNVWKLESVLQNFARQHQFIQADESTLQSVLGQLVNARERVSCLLQPQDQHLSLPDQLRGLNEKSVGDGIILRSGFIHVDSGEFLPISETKFNGSEYNSTLAVADLPHPLNKYCAAAMRVRGGIPLASLADIETWYYSYDINGAFHPDVKNTNRVRQRVFFHPTRAGLATPDLIQQGSNPQIFPYLMLASALLRYNKNPHVWTGLAHQYDLQMRITSANPSDSLRIPINLDELCCAIHEKLTHTDTKLLDEPEIIIFERPLWWDMGQQAVQNLGAMVSNSQQEQAMVKVLENFLTHRGGKKPTEIIADWEVWVLGLLMFQIKQRPNKEMAIEQRRYLIRFAYNLLEQINCDLLEHFTVSKINGS